MLIPSGSGLELSLQLTNNINIIFNKFIKISVSSLSMIEILEEKSYKNLLCKKITTQQLTN